MRKISRFILNRLLITILVWVIYKTTRIKRVNWNIVEELLRSGQPHILYIWHNNIFYFVPFLASHGYMGLISRSKDGEDINWVMERFGFYSVRGSSSSGGATALREAMRLLSKGKRLVFTPDGPRGPRYVIKPGMAAIARKKNIPVVPLCYSAPKRWELGSWDRMKLPKPFSTVTIMAGPPIWPGKNGDTAQKNAGEETDRQQMETALRDLVKTAERFTGADKHYHDPEL